MSGGSWDYLFSDDNASRDMIRAMARQLEETAPGSPAARDTRLLANLLFDERLRETWRAIEWEDSGDGHEEQIADAIAAYVARGSQDRRP